MTEIIRGCGWRKVGALYLVGSGISLPCDMLPLELKECECCGFDIPFTRAFMWLRKNYIEKLTDTHVNCIHPPTSKCPICFPETNELRKYGLMWVGVQFYTAESFVNEAKAIGVSKRIANIPKGLELGKTWVLLAHLKVPFYTEIPQTGMNAEPIYKKAIFYAFIPQRVEMLIWKSQATEEKLRRLEEQGITPVIVEDSEKKHQQTYTSWG